MQWIQLEFKDDHMSFKLQGINIRRSFSVHNQNDQMLLSKGKKKLDTDKIMFLIQHSDKII